MSDGADGELGLNFGKMTFMSDAARTHRLDQNGLDIRQGRS